MKLYIFDAIFSLLWISWLELDLHSLNCFYSPLTLFDLQFFNRKPFTSTEAGSEYLNGHLYDRKTRHVCIANLYKICACSVTCGTFSRPLLQICCAHFYYSVSHRR